MKSMLRRIIIVLMTVMLLSVTVFSVSATENSIEYFEACNYDFYVDGSYIEGGRNFTCDEDGTTLYWHLPYTYGYTVCTMLVQVRGTITAVYMGDGSNTNYPCTITPLSGGYYEITYTGGGFTGHLTFTFYGTGTQTMVSCKVFPRDIYYASPTSMRFVSLETPLVDPQDLDDYTYSSFLPDTLTAVGTKIHRTVILHFVGPKSGDRYYFNLLTKQLDVVNYQLYDESFLPVEHWECSTNIQNDTDISIYLHNITVAWDGTGSTSYYLVLNCSNTSSVTGFVQGVFYTQTNTASEDEQFGIIWKFWNKLLGWVKEIRDNLLGTDDTGAVDDFQDTVGEQASQLEGISGELDAVQKPDAGDVNVDIDGIVSEAEISESMAGLTTLLGNEIIIQVLILCCTFALAGYVIYGKR